MPNLILIFLSIILIFATALVLAGVAEGHIKKWVAGLFLGLCIGLTSWWWISLNEPYRIETEEIYPVKTIEGPNGTTQVVTYIRYGDPQFLNVNKQFGIYVPENTKVKYTKYSKGPYYGITYVTINEKWEIVK
jgi:hypothetical protein